MKDSIIKIFNFIPVIAFFIVYKSTGDLILATAVIVAGCLLSTALEYALKRTISRMQIFMIVAVLVFGIPTVLLKDPSIIKWKVTVVNLVFASLIFVFQYVLKKNPLGYLFGREINMPAQCWTFMASCWMIFFIFAAALNVVIAFYLPSLFGISEAEAESLWVDYKTFGNAILNCVFAILIVAIMLKKNPSLLEELKNKELKK